MPGLQYDNNQEAHDKLREFTGRWSLDALKEMSLREYSNVGDKDTFCYWLEFETELLGRIGGRPSNKFGIWNQKKEGHLGSDTYSSDDHYKWYRKYGKTAAKAFEKVRSLIVEIVAHSTEGSFDKIDSVDFDSLTKWKIAFIYSGYSLMPIYKNQTIRQVARNLEHPNPDRAPLSDLHQYIVSHKPKEEEFFDFAWRQYTIAISQPERNYYIIGSKYEDNQGGDTVDISENILKRSVVSIGYFWGEDFSKVYGKSYGEIYEWCDENIFDKDEKYQTARRAIAYFLQLKPGDLIAVKSHGRFGTLTIIAYAEVVAKGDRVYQPDRAKFPEGLGQIVHVRFLESRLKIETGLNYGQTIHQIIPGDKEGHFEKIFGAYSVLERPDDKEDDEPDPEDRIGNNPDPYFREVSYSTVIDRVHDKLKNAFARHLKRTYPKDVVRTEFKRVDIRRDSRNEVYLYEVKPFNSAYACVRAGIGQLLDYWYSSKDDAENFYLVIVGPVAIQPDEISFIEHVAESLKVSFSYIHFEQPVS